jgi:hypothetical protein
MTENLKKNSLMRYLAVQMKTHTKMTVKNHFYLI